MSVALERVREVELCSGWDASKSTDNSMIGYLNKSFLEVKRWEIVRPELQLVKRRVDYVDGLKNVHVFAYSNMITEWPLCVWCVCMACV